MKTVLLGWIGILASYLVAAQHDCRSFEYQQQLLQKDPGLQVTHNAVQNFSLLQESRISSDQTGKSITIPVVVHVL